MEEGTRRSVAEFIRKEVEDWDDEVTARARFKVFSGQRSDWEPTFLFWKDLILKTARHLGLFILSPSQMEEVKKDWFNRGGLTPLCLDHVLSIMYSEGDIVASGDFVDPTSGRLSQIFSKIRRLMIRPPPTSQYLFQDHLILTALLEGKADEVVKVLSESHWTSSCIITMKKLQGICGGTHEASAVLSYLSGCGKARYLSVAKKELIQGVKVSISPAPVSSITSLDSDVLHLIWTTEKLQQQLDAIDRDYEKSRTSALASLKSGNKKVALRHARGLKLASESREKCTSLLNRVEEVLSVIANAESAKKVSEAIQIGARAMKENQISVEEVQLCLQELDESITSQKQVEEALESTASYSGIEDEDVEEEFKKLEMEVGNVNPHVRITKTDVNVASGETEVLESADLLSDALSKLKLANDASRESANQDSGVPMRNNELKSHKLEAA